MDLKPLILFKLDFLKPASSFAYKDVAKWFFFFFVFADTGLDTQAAGPVPRLVPDLAPGHFLHLGVDGIPTPAHALDPGAEAALDPGPALLILMNTVTGEIEEGEHLQLDSS